MKIFLIIALISLAQGRPEAGYSYRPPSGGLLGGVGSISSGSITNGLSTGNGGSFSGGSNHGSFITSSHHSSGGGSFGSTGFGPTGGLSHGGGGSGGLSHGDGGLSHGSGLSHGGSLSGGHSGGGFIGTTGTSSGGFTSGGSTGFVSGGGLSGLSQGSALVQKHIYVHVPPPDQDDIIPQRQVSVGVPQKHYKIIFIKAPSAPSISQQQVALAAQNQEKTIVYVLVKKPDDINDISLPTIAPTQPSKPEVYFIKYKAQKQTTGGGSTGIITGGTGTGGIIGSTFGGTGSGGITTGIGGSGGSIQHHHHGGSSSSTGTGISSGSILSTGSASSSIGGIPAAQYGPPGKSGPY